MAPSLVFPLLPPLLILPTPKILCHLVAENISPPIFSNFTPLSADKPQISSSVASLNALQGLQCVCDTLLTPFVSPNASLSCPDWLHFLLETLFAVQGDLCNAQVMAPDASPLSGLSTAFDNLTNDKSHIWTSIGEIVSDLDDHFDWAENANLTCLHCLRCVTLVCHTLPPPDDLLNCYCRHGK